MVHRRRRLFAKESLSKGLMHLANATSVIQRLDWTYSFANIQNFSILGNERRVHNSVIFLTNERLESGQWCKW